MQQERLAFLLILFKAGQRFEESAACLRPVCVMQRRQHIQICKVMKTR